LGSTRTERIFAVKQRLAAPSFTTDGARLLQDGMDFLIRQEGRELGPYSEAEIKSRLAAGTIALSDLAVASGETEWKPLSTFAPFGGTSIVEPEKSGDARERLNPGHLGSYTAATLQADERPLHQTTIHWMALSGSVIGALLSLIVIVPIAMFAAWKNFYWVWFLVVIPVGILVSASVTVRTSELVITDRRVLIKVGFIQRHTFEMFISKIESVAVFQSMLGRVFDYGTVTIRGTGGSSESFTTIAAPLQFRDAIQLVQSSSEKR
jgi:Bacterial PH domain/GYF domain 2